MRLLLVNGNRTVSVTEVALAEARRVAATGTEVLGATATFGANIVSTVADNTIAAHAVLDTLARHQQGVDAAILAISLDSGLFAARQLFAFPVLGMTEAGLCTAGLLGERFGMITFGRQTAPLYNELAARYGMTQRLAGHRTVDIASLAAYLDPGAMDSRIVEEAEWLVREAGAQAVLICGAALAGTAARLQGAVAVPLVDGIASAVRLAEGLVRANYRHCPPAHPAAPDMQGIAPELAALFRNV
jgi:allantoin racemase